MHTVEVLGLRVYDVLFFQTFSHSNVVAAPSVTAAEADLLAKEWSTGRADLDFVLFERKADASQDKKSNVDYRFLRTVPMPARRPGETKEARAQVLKSWMAECYLANSPSVLSDQLQETCSTLRAEYDNYLHAITNDAGRSVRGVVSRTEDGHHIIVLLIPLLMSEEEKVRQALNNLAALYAKAMHIPYSSIANEITSARFELHIRFNVTSRGRRPAVQAERMSVHLEDRSVQSQSSFVPFLQSCMDLRSLPQYSNTSQRGATFLDYIPQLESALYRSVREPLHFMKLVLSLSARFGDPVEVCTSHNDLDNRTKASKLVKSTSFCVVDRATLFSFMIGMHYYGGEQLPSVGVVANQYLGTAHEQLLRMKIQYPVNAAAMRRDADGFFDVEELSTVIETSTLASMTYLMSTCQ